MDDRELWQELGKQLRIDSIRASAAAGSGHPTSSMSAADLMSVLLAKYFLYDFSRPEEPSNDHLIFSKGHASPLLYAMFKAAGALEDDELLRFRKLDSRLQGHPTPALPWVDVATGSLGQGLPVAVGVALAGMRLDKLPYRVWVLCGDGELAEGSMWEAFAEASAEKLSNLTAILDINRLGQSGETRYGWDLDVYADRLRAFGWHVVEIDGHDVCAIDQAYAEALSIVGRPTAVLARTVKGSGVADVANKNHEHGKPLAHPDQAIAEIGGRNDLRVWVAKPRGGDPHVFETHDHLALPRYAAGQKLATRKAFGDALAALGDARGDVVVLDGDVKNSTYTERFADEHPERFFQAFIAEQQMVSLAIGFDVRGWTPFAATFGAFFSRAYDFIRMAAVGGRSIRLVGSHAGVSIGEDGPSQMALEDLAELRAVAGSTVLYPCDANQTARLVAAMADLPGVVYLRTTRGATPVVYDADEDFPIGGSKALRSSDADDVAIVAAGITVHEALAAADALAKEGVRARVLDAYSVKPIDVEGLREAADACGGRVVTVEDHRPEGGLGEAVLDAFATIGASVHLELLAVRGVPPSGTPAELLARMHIDASAIADAARSLVRGERGERRAA